MGDEGQGRPTTPKVHAELFACGILSIFIKTLKAGGEGLYPHLTGEEIEFQRLGNLLKVT